MINAIQILRRSYPLLPAALAAMVSWPGVAFADRHCSYGDERLLYAREFAADALAGNGAMCRSKVADALERLTAARQLYEICSCPAADAVIGDWLRARDAADTEICPVTARRIQTLVRRVKPLTAVCY